MSNASSGNNNQANHANPSATSHNTYGGTPSHRHDSAINASNINSNGTHHGTSHAATPTEKHSVVVPLANPYNRTSASITGNANATCSNNANTGNHQAMGHNAVSTSQHGASHSMAPKAPPHNLNIVANNVCSANSNGAHNVNASAALYDEQYYDERPTSTETNNNNNKRKR
jgi:hypothetical protein